MAVAPSDGEGALPDKKEPGAAQEAKAAEDNTPTYKDIFLLARQQNFPAALKLLEAYPHFWTARDDEGHSLLHWGALVGSRDFCKAVLANGVEVDAQAENKQTPLMWAVLRGHLHVARLLLDSKANLQIRDSLGATPLMIAIQHKNYLSMLLLMHRGSHALLADGDKNGCTGVHWAAYKGDITALKLLDYFEADMCALDNTKMLPLHRAVCASQAQVIEFLLEKRSDTTQRNADGKTVMDIAEEQRDQQMQSLLKKLLRKTGPSLTGGKEEDMDLELGDEAKPKQRDGIMKSLMKAGQDKTAQKAFPVFWLVCVSMAVFEYLMDLRSTSYQVAPTASMLFEVGVPLSLALFFWVALTDPGKVPAKAKGKSGVEELMRALEENDLERKVPDISRLCTTTWVLKDLRTKYCSQTGACVEEFDHWCVWLNCSIGKKNHRQFICLAVVEWLTQVCHVYLCWCMARALVTYQSMGSWLLTVVSGYPLLALIGFVQLLTAPFVLMLIVYQSRLVAMNLTTNEMMNAPRYEHFWVMKPTSSGHLQRMYRNPFTKGGIFKNCLDFWWFRTRSEVVARPEMRACNAPHCAECHRGH
eukprot:CAMPEP_0179051544 /NCGR_PEP_ID=MMETSP0796-20121207/21300_1 /TAXON_ID=73915 /ORGANISM="Pyrodinium bahamense, Strain pbaha01" /LENGTH=586 /DNA_ID=CAMNT_0020748089 /DNA_START=66 /DNA_END=1826 /DNA_ORIENTATION=+